MSSSDRPSFIPSHGYYQNLLSDQKVEVVYDLTFNFCERFLKRGDRTIHKMVQAEVVANIAICLIHQTNYLLDQQIRRLEQDFIKEGGLRERMTKARLQY